MRRRRHPTRPDISELRAARSEAGDTLVEILVAVLLVSVAGLAILVGFRTAIVGSSIDRTVATSDTVLRTAAQQATVLMQQAPASAWSGCTDASLTPSQFVLPSGYQAKVASVSYWNTSTSSFASSCIANTAQLVSLTVTEGTSSWSISFVVNDPNQPPITQAQGATQLVFLQQPSNTAAGSAISPPPVVAVEDPNGTIVTTDLSPVSISITPGSGTSGASLSSTCAGTEVYGVVTFNSCSIAATGTGYTLTVSDGALTPATSNPFSVTAPPGNTLVFLSAPTGSQPVSNTSSIGPFEVQVQDVNGNPVPAPSPITVGLESTSNGTASGGSPFFSLSQGAGSSGAVTSVTVPSGSSTTAPFYYSDTSAGTPTITAFNASLVAATTSFTMVPGPAAQVAFEAPPTSVAVHTSFVVTIAEVDAYGNVEAGDSSASVTLTATGGGFACTTSPTHVTNGVATFSGCTFTTASATGYTLTAKSGSLGVATTQVVVTPAAASKLVYAVPPPATIGAGAPFGFTVSEEDAYGNVETGDSTTAISVGASGGGGGFSCTTAPTTVTQGVATFSGCTFTTAAANPYTLTATSGSLTQATAQVTVVGLPTKLVFSTAPPTWVVTGTGFTVGVSDEDAFGHVEVSDSTTPVNLSASGGGFSCTTTPATVTDGTATFTGCSFANASTTPYTLTASSGTLTAATASITVVGPPAKLVYTTSPPASAVAGGTFSVTVAEEDSLGNVETGDSTTTLSLTSGGGFSCTTTPSHVTNGTASFTGCSFTVASASPYTVTAASGSLAPATASTTVSPGVARKWVFTSAPPASVVAGTSFGATVAEEDAYGNVETADSSTAVTFASSGSGSGFTCSTAPTHVTNGTASFSGCSYHVASSYTLTASGGGLTSATSPISVAPAGASKLVYTTAPPTATGAGSTFNVVVAEQDPYGNTETADSSTTLTLTANNGGGGFTCATTPTKVTAGVASYQNCKFTGASTTAYTVTAASGTLTSATANVTVSPGTPTQLLFTTMPPSAVTAGSTFSVAVIEEDAYGNVETNDSSTSVSISANDGGGGLACTTSPTKLTSGNATFSGCSFRTASSSAYTLTVSAGSLNASSQVTVSPSTPTKLVYTTAPPTTTTAGSTFGVVVAEQDAYGNTETTDSSTTLTLTANNGGGGFACTTTPTKVTAGVATYQNCKFTVASATAYTVTAASGTLTSATANVTVSPGTPTQLLFTTAPPTSTQVGTTFSVAVVEQDAYGNVETGDSSTSVSIGANDGGGGLACTTSPTKLTGGTATFSGCSFHTAVGSPYTLSVTAGTLTASAQVTVVHGTPTQLAFTTGPQTFERGTTSGTEGSGTITVTLEDAGGNPVPAPSGGVAVTLHSTSSTGTFSPASLTIAAGTSSASFSYADTTSGSPTITASATGYTSATQVETVLGNALDTTVTVGTSTPSTVTAGSSATYTVTVDDTATGGSRNDYAISSVSGIPSGATWSSSACQTIRAGRDATFTLTVDTADSTPGGTTTLAVVATAYSSTSGSCSGGTTGTGQGDGTLSVSAPAVQLSFGTEPQSSAHGTTLASVTVLVEDAEYDVVAGSTSQVTIALGANPGGATLTGTLTVTAVNGIATFSNLKISAAGTGYTLVASSTGLASATSTGFNQS